MKIIFSEVVSFNIFQMKKPKNEICVETYK